MTVALGDARGRLVVAATVLGSGMAFLDSTVVNIALPAVGRELGREIAGLQWVMDAYLLTLAAFLLLGGSLGDLFGRRRVFAVGLVGFVVASVLCGIAPTMPALIGARALQGMAGALLVPTSLAILSSSFDGAKRGKAIGLWTGFSGVWAAAGPVLGGALVDAWTWRLVFFINVPVGALALLLAMRAMPESKDPRAGRRLDVAGASTVALGLAGAVFVLIEGPSRGFGSAPVLVAAAVAVLASASFIVIEARRSDPMMPLWFFRVRRFAGANLATLLVYAALSGSFFFIVLQLQVRLEWSATAAGTALIPVTVMLLALSPAFGRLAETIGPRAPMTIGPIVAAGGLALFARLQEGATYLGTVLPAASIFGFGLAITVAPLTATALGALEERHAGIASAINNAVARAAGLIAIAVLPLAAGVAGADLDGLTTAAFRRAILVAAGLAFAGGVVSFLMIRSERRAA